MQLDELQLFFHESEHADARVLGLFHLIFVESLFTHEHLLVEA